MSLKVAGSLKGRPCAPALPLWGWREAGVMMGDPGVFLDSLVHWQQFTEHLLCAGPQSTRPRTVTVQNSKCSEGKDGVGDPVSWRVSQQEGLSPEAVS